MQRLFFFRLPSKVVRVSLHQHHSSSTPSSSSSSLDIYHHLAQYHHLLHRHLPHVCSTSRYTTTIISIAPLIKPAIMSAVTLPHPIVQDSSIWMLGPAPTIYTTPSLTINLVCRVFFGILANLVCLIPLQLLYRNGEFAAVVFILNVELENLRNIVNALIWRNDDMESWWPGYGLCDVDAFLHNFCISIFSTCLLAIMRNLAIQVGSLRANPPSRKEKRRRNIIQALIIFPLPLMQVAWTYPLAKQRYYVGTLIGCYWPDATTWPSIVFEILPQAIVSLITAGYASKFCY